MLIAKRPILHGSILYQPGDELPAADPALVEAWVKAGSVALREALPVEKAPDIKAAEEHAEEKTSDDAPEVNPVEAETPVEKAEKAKSSAKTRR